MKELFYTPKPALFIVWFRVLVFGVLGWLLLSRDMGIFALAPQEVLDFHARYTFGAGGTYALAMPYIVEALTFHWIHWFLPFPSVSQLVFLQFAGVAGCFAVILFGRGPKNLLVISVFILLTYLWGYLWRTGSPHDAVFPFFQIILVYCLTNFAEITVLAPRADKWLAYRKEYGAFFSIFLMLLVLYYFFSGLQKLVDISVLEWFQYEIYEIIRTYQVLEPEYHKPMPDIYAFFVPFSWLNYILVPMVYIEHLLTPLMWFYRRFIPQFWVFYLSFHLFSLVEEVMFVGLMLSWFLFLPVERFVEPVKASLPARYRKGVAALNWFGLVQIEKKPARKFRTTDGRSKKICEGFAAVRRLLWALPLLWPLIPLVYVAYYFPGLHFILAGGQYVFSKRS